MKTLAIVVTVAGLSLALLTACAGLAVTTSSTAAPTNLSMASPSATAPSVHDVAATFNEFPVLWLGDTFDVNGDGTQMLPLASAAARAIPEDRDPRTGALFHAALREFQLTYGDCQIKPGRESCPVPVALTFYAPDAAPVLSDTVKTGKTVHFRGIDATVYGESSSLWVETADVTFSIGVVGGTPDENLKTAMRIAINLEGANAKAKNITSGSELAPKPTSATPVPAATLSPNVSSTDIASTATVAAQSTQFASPP